MEPAAEQTSLFEGYEVAEAWDEMLMGPATPRTPYRAVHHTLAAMGSESLPAINARQFYVTVSRGRQDVLHDRLHSPGGALVFLRGAAPRRAHVLG